MMKKIVVVLIFVWLFVAASSKSIVHIGREIAMYPRLTYVYDNWYENNAGGHEVVLRSPDGHASITPYSSNEQSTPTDEEVIDLSGGYEIVTVTHEPVRHLDIMSITGDPAVLGSTGSEELVVPREQE